MENDDIIARFMGFTRNERGKYNIGLGDFDTGNLQYSKSWDHLMPVVEKIHDVAPTEVREINNESLTIFEFGSICIPINEVYSAVVEFIKWYNSQPPRV